MKREEQLRAIREHDSRYDGRFYYGVKTTGIVCRPSCKAKVPQEKNIVLFDRYEEALAAGFRPCKICMKENRPETMEPIQIRRWQSPAGEMIVGSHDGKLCICDWAVEKRRATINRRIQRHLNAHYETGSSEIIEKAIAQLEEYFAHRRQTFDIPLVFTGSEFQCTVWSELMKIPYGSTISYAELARRIRNPKAVRAVASANANNPISILVPCHRVIGSNRTLTGYGGGLDTKKRLLELETATVSAEQSLF